MLNNRLAYWKYESIYTTDCGRGCLNIGRCFGLLCSSINRQKEARYSRSKTSGESFSSSKRA